MRNTYQTFPAQSAPCLNKILRVWTRLGKSANCSCLQYLTQDSLSIMLLIVVAMQNSVAYKETFGLRCTGWINKSARRKCKVQNCSKEYAGCGLKQGHYVWLLSSSPLCHILLQMAIWVQFPGLAYLSSCRGYVLCTMYFCWYKEYDKFLGDGFLVLTFLTHASGELVQPVW
jgi:hypothetical protein